jgi:rubredoxin
MTLKQEIRGEGFLSGVTFFSLPDDWLCPECSAGKDEFALVVL